MSNTRPLCTGDLEYKESKMKKLLLAIALSIAIASPAAAANTVRYSSEWTGAWCAGWTSEGGWTYFNRGIKTCEADAGLVLKQNGDYFLHNGDQDEHCKADPKSFFKGWADYTCTDNHGRTKKRHLKFLIDTSTGELMQSPSDE
jgi:hypothetical protein